jgi:hypothetical protein
VYVPLFESTDGGQVRIVSTGTSKLNVAPGAIERVHGSNFMRVGSQNLRAFAARVHQMSTGATVTNVYQGTDGLRAFKDQREFESFLRSKGIQVEKPAEQPKVLTDPKPLKPPEPPSGPRPRDPLHDPPVRSGSGSSSVDETTRSPGGPAVPATAPPRPGGRATTAAAAGREADSARAIAEEVAATETGVTRMATAAKVISLGLAAWNIYNTVLLVAQARNMAADTLAYGTPYWEAIQQGKRAAARANQTEKYWGSLDLRTIMPSAETDPDTWNGWDELRSRQFEFVRVESQLSDTLGSIADAIHELDVRRKQLKDGIDERVEALLLPVTSLVYAEAFLFSDAARQINESIDKAIASYKSARADVLTQQNFARAAAKTIERRLRALGSEGLFGAIEDADLRDAELSHFTFRH